MKPAGLPKNQSRRNFIKKIGFQLPASLLGAQFSSYFNPAWAGHGGHLLPLGLPDFSEQNVIRSVAGLRPYRANGVRLEVQSAYGKTVIHNYGHGGAGFTLSWGSAIEAADLLRALGGPKQKIAVLGAGVIGLSTAIILSERGYDVKIYAAHMSPKTTSDLAGAQWSPSFVAAGESRTERERYVRMLGTSYRRFEALSSDHYGVHLKQNYLFEGYSDDLQSVPHGILQAPLKLARFPFLGRPRGGTIFQSWLIEPPVYMPAIIEDLKKRNTEFEIRELTSFEQVKELSESIVVNCCGLGAARLVNDASLIPIKGQLLHLNPQANLDYILLHSGYVFCRRDAIVLGGSFEKGNFSESPDPAIARKILTQNRRFFFDK